MRRRAGFTLLEVLIAVMLTGMVTSLALAPVVMTVRRVVELQSSYSDTLALSRTVAFIGRDVAAAVRTARQNVWVEDHQALGGGEDDTLVVMTTSPTRQRLAAGTVVYRIEHGGGMRKGVVAGLYRWVLPGKHPVEVKLSGLAVEDGELVLPGVTAFNVEVPEGGERKREYRGELPAGLAIALTRGSGKDAESLEDIVVFQ